ncbi:MAG: FAD-dependent oxidoreductase, partial [Thermomicrobiales bacterium]
MTNPNPSSPRHIDSVARPPRALTRRAVLGASLAAAAPLLRPAAAAAQSSAADLAVSPLRVIVIGAGMSGLTAALALHRRGHDVRVVEYQNRFGGRLISV